MILETIIVPIINWRESDIVLEHIVSLAIPFSTRVILLGIMSDIDESSQFTDPVIWNASRCEAQAILNRHIQYLRLKNIAAKVEIMEAPSMEQFFQYVDNSACNLILSTTSQNKDHWLNNALLKHTNVPVFVAENKAARVKYNNILVALDGSQRAESSLNLAIAFAKQMDARVHLGHAVQQIQIPRRAQMTPEDLDIIEQLNQRNIAEGEKYLTEIASRLVPDAQIHVNIDEKVSTALHDLIAEHDIDLLILSAHGYSGEPQWSLGSVAENLIRYSQVPAILVQDLPAHIEKSQPDPSRMINTGAP